MDIFLFCFPKVKRGWDSDRMRKMKMKGEKRKNIKRRAGDKKKIINKTTSRQLLAKLSDHLVIISAVPPWRQSLNSWKIYRSHLFVFIFISIFLYYVHPCMYVCIYGCITCCRTLEAVLSSVKLALGYRKGRHSSLFWVRVKIEKSIRVCCIWYMILHECIRM